MKRAKQMERAMKMVGGDAKPLAWLLFHGDILPGGKDWYVGHHARHHAKKHQIAKEHEYRVRERHARIVGSVYWVD